MTCLKCFVVLRGKHNENDCFVCLCSFENDLILPLEMQFIIISFIAVICFVEEDLISFLSFFFISLLCNGDESWVLYMPGKNFTIELPSPFYYILRMGLAKSAKSLHFLYIMNCEFCFLNNLVKCNFFFFFLVKLFFIFGGHFILQ